MTTSYPRIPPAPISENRRHQLRPLSKHEFITQYVLNRAAASVTILSGESLVHQAISAWVAIQKTPTGAATKTP